MKLSNNDIVADRCLIRDWKYIILKRRDSIWMKKTLRFNGSLLRKCDTVQKLRNIFTHSYLVSQIPRDSELGNAQEWKFK